MASSTLCDEISLISKGLYRIVSDIVGPECIVKLRRQGWDISDDIFNCYDIVEYTRVMSGSRGEGFDFRSSDLDSMYIDKNAIVLTSSTFITAQYIGMPTILLMDTENVSPGFAFIRCLRYNQSNETLTNALEYRGYNVFVSSKKIRESFLSSNNSECHGPCQQSNMHGLEEDHAFTLRCPIWPKQAISFVRRSLLHGWPSYDTLTDICRDGCLFVPINSKQQQYSDMTDLQWRISFSLAEKKLVHSMNHYQFLCYGLSKLFLNEVLKKLSPNEELLCSYFMKTAVFWEISENPSDWSPFNFLSKFLCVFSRLIKWVSLGYCPNFFIPENNMFQGKIFGEKQRALLETLRDLYMDGYWSLLRCPSLNENLSKLFLQPKLAYTLSIDESEYVPLSTIEEERLQVILNFDPCFATNIEVSRVRKILINIFLMMKRDSTENKYAVRLGANQVLQLYARNLFSSRNSYNITNTRNRIKYNDFKTAECILSRTETFFCMNDFVLINHFYKTGNYQRTIEMIHYTRHKLQSQPFMYEWNLDGGIIMTALQEGMSYDRVVKSLIVDVAYIDEYTAVEELISECLADAETNGGTGQQVIPPLVYLNFLLILSYTRLGEFHRRYDILDELLTLLHHDDGHHILYIEKAISWEILGICQQVCGDRQGAYVSYRHALEDKYNYFMQATLQRIYSLGN